MADRARRGLQLVSSVVRAFSESTADYQRLLVTIARNVAEAIPDTCILTLRSDDGRTMTPSAIHDADPAVVAALEPLRRAHVMAEATLSAEAISHGSLFMPDVDLKLLSSRTSAGALFRTIGTRGLIVVPMRSGGELQGVLTLLRRRPDHPAFDELDLEIVEDLAGHAALAIGNARLVARLQDELARRAAAERALEVSEKLRIAEERAVQASLFLDAIIENIPDMVFVKDADRLAFVRCNRAGEALLGVSREDLLGKTDFDLFPASEAEFFTAMDRETLASQTLVEITEEPIHTSRGPRWLHTKKVPLVDADGRTRYLLGISHDITDRKRTEAKLRAAKENFDHANAELESFAYSVAHDLRTPLRGILGYSQAVIEDVGDTLAEQPRRYLQRVQDSAERMAHLIDDLLGFARVTQAELHRSRVDLTAVAHALVAGLQAADRDRTVEVVIAPELVVDADPHLIATTLDNLIDNAWKFTSKRADARIEIGSLIQDGRPTYFVRDNGAGFDVTYAEQLFGVFRRMHRQEEFPGTGIGLATVARIIHRHQGRVWGEGEVDRGATFYFTLGDPLDA